MSTMPASAERYDNIRKLADENSAYELFAAYLVKMAEIEPEQAEDMCWHLDQQLDDIVYDVVERYRGEDDEEDYDDEEMESDY